MIRGPYRKDQAVGITPNLVPAAWQVPGSRPPAFDVRCASLDGRDVLNVSSYTALALDRLGRDNRHVVKRLEAIGAAFPIIGDEGRPLFHVGRSAEIDAGLRQLGLLPGDGDNTPTGIPVAYVWPTDS